MRLTLIKRVVVCIVLEVVLVVVVCFAWEREDARLEAAGSRVEGPSAFAEATDDTGPSREVGWW